jgi:hypothetical protein
MVPLKVGRVQLQVSMRRVETEGVDIDAMRVNSSVANIW